LIWQVGSGGVGVQDFWRHAVVGERRWKRAAGRGRGKLLDPIARDGKAHCLSSTLSIFVGAQTSKNRRFLMVR